MPAGTTYTASSSDDSVFTTFVDADHLIAYVVGVSGGNGILTVSAINNGETIATASATVEVVEEAPYILFYENPLEVEYDPSLEPGTYFTVMNAGQKEYTFTATSSDDTVIDTSSITIDASVGMDHVEIYFPDAQPGTATVEVEGTNTQDPSDTISGTLSVIISDTPSILSIDFSENPVVITDPQTTSYQVSASIQDLYEQCNLNITSSDPSVATAYAIETGQGLYDIQINIWGDGLCTLTARAESQMTAQILAKGDLLVSVARSTNNTDLVWLQMAQGDQPLFFKPNNTLWSNFKIFDENLNEITTINDATLSFYDYNDSLIGTIPATYTTSAYATSNSDRLTIGSAMSSFTQAQVEASKVVVNFTYDNVSNSFEHNINYFDNV